MSSSNSSGKYFLALCEFVVFKSAFRKIILLGENKTCDMTIVRRVLVIPQLFGKSKEINMHYCTEVSYNEKKICYMYASLFLKIRECNHCPMLGMRENPLLVTQKTVV